MLKLNQQKHMITNQTTISDHSIVQKDSLRNTPIKRKLSEYVIQKQNSYAQIHKPERQKQKSTPDILQLLKRYQKCHTNTSQQKTMRETGNKYNIQKHKTFHNNNDASPIKISQEALPLKNITINRKRTSTSDRDLTLLKLKELKRKIQEKVPNPLDILGPDGDQISNRITFQASLQTEESKMIHKTIETPGTAQFMQSNRDENILDHRNPFERANSLENVQSLPKQEQPNLQKRKPSCCEESFKPVQKTVSLHKPYFESHKGEEITNFTNRLECRKIMIILDQDKEKILDQIALNPLEIHNSPTSSVWDKALKIDKLDEQIYKQKTEESRTVRVKRGSQKNENIPYWKLRDLDLKKKKK